MKLGILALTSQGPENDADYRRNEHNHDAGTDSEMPNHDRHYYHLATSSPSKVCVGHRPVLRGRDYGCSVANRRCTLYPHRRGQ